MNLRGETKVVKLQKGLCTGLGLMTNHISSKLWLTSFSSFCHPVLILAETFILWFWPCVLRQSGKASSQPASFRFRRLSPTWSGIREPSWSSPTNLQPTLLNLGQTNFVLLLLFFFFFLRLWQCWSLPLSSRRHSLLS